MLEGHQTTLWFREGSLAGAESRRRPPLLLSPTHEGPRRVRGARRQQARRGRRPRRRSTGYERRGRQDREKWRLGFGNRRGVRAGEPGRRGNDYVFRAVIAAHPIPPRQNLVRPIFPRLIRWRLCWPSLNFCLKNLFTVRIGTSIFP